MTSPDITININLAGVGDLPGQLARLETLMTEANDKLVALATQLADTKADVLAKIGQLQEQLGTLPADAQATLDSIIASVGDLDATVGDADGSEGTPSEPEPTEPVL